MMFCWWNCVIVNFSRYKHMHVLRLGIEKHHHSFRALRKTSTSVTYSITGFSFILYASGPALSTNLFGFSSFLSRQKTRVYFCVIIILIATLGSLFVYQLSTITNQHRLSCWIPKVKWIKLFTLFQIRICISSRWNVVIGFIVS